MQTEKLHDSIKKLIDAGKKDHIWTASKLIIAYTPPYAGDEPAIHRLCLSRKRPFTVSEFDGDTVWANTRKRFPKGQAFELVHFAPDDRGCFVIEWKYVEQRRLFEEATPKPTGSGQHYERAF